MTAPREWLTTQLRSKVERHGVVVWSDPHGEYRDVADAVAPEQATFERFDGSWYHLRRRIEPALAGADPQLVIYVDVDAPADDPLEEARRTGTVFRSRLSRVVKQTMANELATAKLDEIARTASTLAEAEALIEGGGGGGPAQLIKTFGPNEPTELLLSMLDRKPDEQPAEVFAETVAFLSSHLGMPEVARDDDLAAATARHLVVAELATALGRLPDPLAHLAEGMRAEQRDRSVALLDRWRRDSERRDRFVELMRQADSDLALSGVLEWSDPLAELQSVPVYDDIALDEYLRRMEADRFVEAEELAAARLAGSLWAREPLAGADWHERWAVAHAAARLRRSLSTAEPTAHDLSGILESYQAQDWRTDHAYRRLQLALPALTSRGALEQPVLAAEQAYESWLDALLRRFSSTLADQGLDTDLLSQGRIHGHTVAPLAKHGTVAYFMVDALRFELGQELVETALSRQFPDAEIDISAAVTLLPSITPVGMANLCPGADDGLGLALDANNRLAVTIDGQPVMTPPHRVARLQAAHGTVTDLTLDDVFRLPEHDLSGRIDGASLVLVRSQEIDQAGESGKLAIGGANAFNEVLAQLSRAVARLADRGISRFVLTADHGFVSTTREVGGHMVAPKPGGSGELHRRAFVGKGGSAGDALVRIPVSKLGVSSDLDVIVPAGLALIAAGGSRGFFHGGASPQEMVVPVITLTTGATEGAVEMVVEATLAAAVTSQLVLGKVGLQQDLLSQPLTVRVALVRTSDEGGQEVATIATTDAEDHVGEGILVLQPGRTASIGFRLTRSLNRGDKVELQVYDARTDRRLATSKPATARRPLEVDDELT